AQKRNQRRAPAKRRSEGSRGDQGGQTKNFFALPDAAPQQPGARTHPQRRHGRQPRRHSNGIAERCMPSARKRASAEKIPGLASILLKRAYRTSGSPKWKQ